MKLLCGDDLEAVLASEIKVILRVHLSAQSNLENVLGNKQAFFDGTPHRSAMRVRAAEVSAPGIVVRVELNEADAPKAFVNGTQNGEQNGVIAAYTCGS